MQLEISILSKVICFKIFINLKIINIGFKKIKMPSNLCNKG